MALIDKISNFVESIRLDGKQSSRQSSEKHERRSILQTPPTDSRHVEYGQSADIQVPGTSKDSGYRHNSVHGATGDDHTTDRVTDQLLVQAEKFRARVEAPKGNVFNDMLMPYDYERLRSKFIKPEGLGPIDSKNFLNWRDYYLRIVVCLARQMT